MADEPLIPSAFTLFEQFKEEQPEITLEQGRRAQMVELFSKPGWDLIEDHIKTVMKRMKSFEINKTDSVEMIGFKELAARMVETALQSILNIKELAVMDAEELAKRTKKDIRQ